MAETFEQHSARLCRIITHYENMIIHIQSSYSPQSTAVLHGIPRLKERLGYLYQERDRLIQANGEA